MMPEHSGSNLERVTSSPLLTIVIPAYNEEEAVGSTIERCLAARQDICDEAGLRGIELVVVSDGSTDQTAAIAAGYPDVRLIEFPENRGYGAALKAGFAGGSGELVGFLDADGTCDPIVFGALSREVVEGRADIALGSRLGPDSSMPSVRRLGNRIFATLLGLISNRSVSDSASGMRVMRRSALASLGPLPGGLHYTPAMSARALLSGLPVVEIPMPYSERVGQSKLSVVADGVRFARAIADALLYHRPQRLFLALALITLIPAVLISLQPTAFYLANRSFEEWMIYRFVLVFLLGSTGMLALGAVALTYHMSDLGHPNPAPRTFWETAIRSAFTSRHFAWIAALVLVVSVFLVWPGLVEYARTRSVTLHWSRVVVAAFGVFVVVQTALTRTLLRIARLWLENGQAPRQVPTMAASTADRQTSA